MIYVLKILTVNGESLYSPLCWAQQESEDLGFGNGHQDGKVPDKENSNGGFFSFLLVCIIYD